MKYEVNFYIKNNTSWGLTPNSTATAADHGYYTGEPQYAGPNTSGVDAGTLVAAQSTWTGCEGISVYVSPGPTQLVILLGDMPYVGYNKCKVAVKPSTTTINEDLVGHIYGDSSISTSATFSGTVDGVTKNFSLSGSIEQGTVVSAKFTFDVTN